MRLSDVDKVPRTYAEVDSAEGLAAFIVAHIPMDARWDIYKALQKNKPEILGDMDPAQTPEQLVSDHLFYLVYTAAWNLGTALVQKKVITEQQFDQDFL